MHWHLDIPVRTVFTSQALLVCEWHCEGGPQPVSRELARYHQVDLLHFGSHVRTAGRRRSVIDPTRAAIHAPGDEFDFASPTGAPQKGTLLLIQGALCEQLKLGKKAVPHVLSARSSRLHARLVAAEAEPERLEALALALVSSVWSDEGDDRLALEMSPAHQRLSEGLQHQVASRFRESCTLESLAAACGVSVFHACRVFRRATGLTLNRYLNRYRLRAALFELRAEGGSLIDVALNNGFASHSHFSASFRREYGCTPTSVSAELRRQ